MTRLVLLTARDCHLCDHGREVLAELEVEWREVAGESDEGRRLAAVAPPMRPVLYSSDGRMLAYGRLSLRKLRKAFGRGVAAA